MRITVAKPVEDAVKKAARKYGYSERKVVQNILRLGLIAYQLDPEKGERLLIEDQNGQREILLTEEITQ